MRAKSSSARRLRSGALVEKGHARLGTQPGTSLGTQLKTYLGTSQIGTQLGTKSVT